MLVEIEYVADSYVYVSVDGKDKFIDMKDLEPEKQEAYREIVAHIREASAGLS